MSFNAINIALSGINATQKALEVTGHNITNVNTPGYHRQEAVMQANHPYPSLGNPASNSGGMYGTGVTVTEVRRLQDNFIQSQLRTVEGQIGRLNTLYSGLSQVEGFLAPGRNIDLSSMLDRFFSKWDELSTYPELESSRLAVRSEGINLANTLNDTAGQLDFMSSLADANLQERVDRINNLADKLAALNAQIGQAREEQRSPNDLLDQREIVLTELTKLVGASSLAVDQEVKSITNIGGRSLVQGGAVYRVKFDFHLDPDGVQRKRILWESDGELVDVPTGEVAGIYELRDAIIPNYKEQIDTIAARLIQSVNALHTTGVNMNGSTNVAFFEGTDAGSIRVNTVITTDDAVLGSGARNIAATTLPDSLGDGNLATEIFTLSRALLVGGTQTLNQAAQSMIGQIGNGVKNTKTSMEAFDSLKQQLHTRQQRASGVSLDEEMTNMLMYQRSYDASARMMVAADEMLKSLLELVR